MKAATDKSDAANAVYRENEADMDAELASLKEAIKVLKSSKSPSLVQLQSIGKTVQQAALMADALGLGGAGVQKAATFFLQQGDVPVEMEDYKFHSSGIIDTLEKLLGDFRATKADTDADEVKRVQAFNMFIQDRTDLVKAKTLEMEQAKKDREQKIEDIGTASQELSTVSASLLDNMEYLDETNTICSEKAKTWDQRSKVRAGELTAVTQPTLIVKSTVAEKTASSTVRLAQTGVTLRFADAVANSDSAMEAIESESEAFDLDFFQKKSIKNHSPEDA